MRASSSALLLVLATAVAHGAACGDTPDAAQGTTSGPPGPDGGVMPPDAGAEMLPCAPGSLEQSDGTCLQAGVPDLPCAPGELLVEGACVTAGVPPSACGPGFASDGDGVCDAILPAEPCGPGTVALPGETLCRPVAPCGAGTWGDVPIDAATQHVDGSYAGGDGDGTPAKPWTTIQAGVDAAMPGAIVAVAAGTYAEGVVIDDKPVRLWGKCPAEVTISPPPGGAAAIEIGPGASASATEVRAVALTGPSAGLIVRGASDVVVDAAWIHDTGYLGVIVEDTGGPTGVELTSTLIEAAWGIGVFVSGAEVVLEDCVVRDTQPTDELEFGRGVTGCGIL